ncbi:MAG: PilZ domain-containing protein, partial [Myxococcales bacterium]|nr:PilZ domain-containing protein [Myxococcales bacterium]
GAGRDSESSFGGDGLFLGGHATLPYTVAMRTQERRSAERMTVGLPVRQVVGEEVREGWATSLSAAGLFMRVPEGARGPDRIQIELALPGAAEPVWASAEVVREDSVGGGRGLRFEAMAGAHAGLLDRWLRGRRGLRRGGEWIEAAPGVRILRP